MIGRNHPSADTCRLLFGIVSCTVSYNGEGVVDAVTWFSVETPAPLWSGYPPLTELSYAHMHSLCLVGVRR